MLQLPDKVTAMEIACGNNHTVVLDDKGCVYTWGFGGYGRLGHADNVRGRGKVEKRGATAWG